MFFLPLILNEEICVTQTAPKPAPSMELFCLMEFFSVLIQQKTEPFVSFSSVYLLLVNLLLVLYYTNISPILWTSLSCSSFVELEKCYGGFYLAYTSIQSSETSLYHLQAWYPGLSALLNVGLPSNEAGIRKGPISSACGDPTECR